MFLSANSSISTFKTKRVKSSQNENYFDVREELAVRMFLTATTMDEKNKIYNEYLRYPLDKMISSIIRRYKLYRKDMDFTEIHTDTHSFLMTKVDKFVPSKEKKAYSYFGTICKNYLMGQILKDQKDTNRKISYEDISQSLENRPDMIYYIENESISAEKIIDVFLTKLKDYVDQKNLQDNEHRLGVALIELFDNYGNIFIGNDNNKFNKNIVLLTLREMTNMSTKEIRIFLKKYKVLYIETLKKIHNE